MTQAFMTSRTVLIALPDAKITCPISAKIAKLCDGELTLGEVAQRLHLPMLICEKIAHRAISKDWLDVQLDISAVLAPEHWQVLQHQVCSVLGDRGVQLLNMAAKMTGLTPGHIPANDLPNYLIAIELSADDEVRETLAPTLDSLRLQLASA